MKIDTTHISPFTNKKSVVVEGEGESETRLCMDTGMTTSTIYKIDSDKIEEFESTTSELIRALRHTDEKLGQYWYPTTIMFSDGVIYPSGHPTNWQWSYSPIIDIPKEKQPEYPIPGQEGKYYDTRLAVEESKYFHNEDFRKVCTTVGLAKDTATV